MRQLSAGYLPKGVKGVGKTYHCGVEVQGKCPVKPQSTEKATVVVC